jgi:CIC family chloride channel protein
MRAAESLGGSEGARSQRLAHVHASIQELRRRLRITQTTWLFLLAGLAGLLAGLGSICFHYLIGAFQWLAFGTASHVGPLAAVQAPGFASWRVVLAPALGGLIVGPLIHFWAREAKGHGVPAVIRAVHERGGRISPVIALVKTIASAITLGSGGSLGREGPVVQIGASIGSGVGQLLGVTPKQLKMLSASGAAAGLAAIFNAPLGGAFFALEVVVGSFAMDAFGPIVIASVSATLVSRGILGDNPVISVAPYQLEHVHELLVYVVLGLVCGVGAVAFTKSVSAGTAVFERVPLPDWAKPALGGVVVGWIALRATPRVLGNGYETIDALMGNRPVEAFLLLVVAAKLVATSVTLGSGGSGGLFGPTLFVGAVLGALVGKAAALVLPVAPPAAYALVGMAAFVAGATHAPVSMVLMIFEMSDNYRIVLPLLIATSVSSALARRMYRESVDTVLDARQGRRIHRNLEEMALHAIHVSEAAHDGARAVVPETATLKAMLDALVTSRSDVLAVVDQGGRYRGVVTAESLQGQKDEAPDAPVIAIDIVRTDVPTLRPQDPLTRAIDAFHGAGVEALPVVQDDRLVAFLSEGDIVSAYRQAVLRSELVSAVLVESSQGTSKRLEFANDIATLEIPAPEWLVGRTLGEVRFRTRFGVSVLAVRRGGAIARLPDPAMPIASDESLVVIGPREAIATAQRGN